MNYAVSKAMTALLRWQSDRSHTFNVNDFSANFDEVLLKARRKARWSVPNAHFNINVCLQKSISRDKATGNYKSRLAIATENRAGKAIDARIKTLAGHSGSEATLHLAGTETRQAFQLPPVLNHGTSHDHADSIWQRGLLPGGLSNVRAEVHTTKWTGDVTNAIIANPNIDLPGYKKGCSRTFLINPRSCVQSETCRTRWRVTEHGSAEAF